MLTGDLHENHRSSIGNWGISWERQKLSCKYSANK